MEEPGLPAAHGSEPASTGRQQCFRCQRPEALCLCPHVPRIAHRTGIHILQHPKERAHPMGTARFLMLGLCNARLEVAFGDGQSVAHPMCVPDRTALLYPDPEAPALESLPCSARPAHLLVIDGTWAQSRALIRQNPWLDRLPRVRIAPPRASRYRVRREPRGDYVSTLEAVQYALAALEPEVDLGPLIDAFERLMDDHLARRDVGGQARMRRPRRRRSRAVPPALADRPDEAAIVYLEPSLADAHPGPRLPVQLCAERLSDGARFEAFSLAHDALPGPRHLEHMGLRTEDFDAAVDVPSAVHALAAFLHGHTPVAWNDTPATLLTAAGGTLPGHISLKAAYCNLRKAHAGSLESVLRSEGLAPGPAGFAGRAGQRVANARALLELLVREAPRDPLG